MGRGITRKHASLVLLLLFLSVDFGSAFWPFSPADPEEFKHESVKSLTKKNFEDYVRTPRIITRCTFCCRYKTNSKIARSSQSRYAACR